MSVDLISRSYVPVRKMKRLLEYAACMGVCPSWLISQAGLEKTEAEYSAMVFIPARDFFVTYKALVNYFQNTGRRVTWAAGVATKNFTLMCRCIESSGTLLEALERAVEFYSLNDCQSENISFNVEGDFVAFEYHLEDILSCSDEALERVMSKDKIRAIKLSSGLQVWHRLCGWLIGTHIDIKRVDLVCCYIDDEYHDKLLQRFSNAAISYGMKANRFYIPKRFVNFRLVNDKKSMDNLLDTMPLNLAIMSSKSVSTSILIKKLLGSNFSNGMPSFSEISNMLNVSCSSLRRRLLKENTSYQKIKDECRCEMAIRFLRCNDLSIGEIGLKLGYTETGSFSRSFSHWTGFSPQVYQSRMSMPL